MDRSDEAWADLCAAVKSDVPAADLGEDAWVVYIASTLITCPDPSLLAQFSSYLIQHDPAFAPESAKNRLSLRLRDTCLKLLTLVGAPRVLCSLMPLAKAEGQVEDKAKTSTLNTKCFEQRRHQLLILTRTSRHNVDVKAIHDRGVETIHTIYDSHFLPRIFASWGAHSADLQFNELFSVYGMYLSDFEYLSAIETEAVVFASITCQGLRGPALWHMRGMGRVLGARGDDDNTETVRRVKDQLRGLKSALIKIVEWVGNDFERVAGIENWVNVGDVTREIGGWGVD